MQTKKRKNQLAQEEIRFRIVDYLKKRSGTQKQAAEAIRVIKSSGKWQPAEQNGHKVIYRQKQAITFVVQEN